MRDRGRNCWREDFHFDAGARAFADRPFYSSRDDMRSSCGVWPFQRFSVVVRWLWLENPVSAAIAPMPALVLASSQRAHLSRSVSTYWAGVALT